MAEFRAATEAPDALAVPRVCGVCAREFAKYTCPRCAMQYCSLPCYKGHGAACTESFHRDQIERALRATSAPPDARAAMASALRRLRATTLDGEPLGSDADDDAAGPHADDADDAVDRDRVEALRRLAARDELDAIALTADEQRDFERHVANGSLSRFLDRAEAWWSGLAAESFCRLPSGEYAALAERVPATIANLPALSALTSRTPPPSIAYLVLELLAAYAYVYRLFDCAPAADARDAAACALQVSAALAGDERGSFADARAALRSVFTRCAHPRTRTSRAFAIASFADARALLGAPGLVGAALGDLHALLFDASAPRGGRRAHATRTELARRKVVFVAAWWSSLPTDALQHTCVELAASVERFARELSAPEDEPQPPLEGGIPSRPFCPRA